MNNGEAPARIERDIEHTRADISRTLDALQERLSVSAVMQEMLRTDQLGKVLQSVGQGSGKFAAGLGRSVRDNPLPVMLTGIGLTWLALGRGASHREYEPHGHSRVRDSELLYREAEAARRMDPSRSAGPISDEAGTGFPPEADVDMDDQHGGLHAGERLRAAAAAARARATQAGEGVNRMSERAGERLGHVGERASEGIGRVKEGLSGAGEGVTRVSRAVTGSVGRVSGAVRGGGTTAYYRSREAARWATHQAGDAAERTGRFIQENPIAAGAVALGVGALLAMMMAPSRREREVLGEASDEIKSRVRGAVHDKVEKAKSVVGSAAEAAMEAARKEATGETAGEATGEQPPADRPASATASASPASGEPSASGSEADRPVSAADTIPPSVRDSGGRSTAGLHGDPIAGTQPGQPSRVRAVKDSPLAVDPETPAVPGGAGGARPDKLRKEKA